MPDFNTELASILSSINDRVAALSEIITAEAKKQLASLPELSEQGLPFGAKVVGALSSIGETLTGPIRRISKLPEVAKKQALTSQLIQKRVKTLTAQGLTERDARTELVERFKRGEEPELTAAQPTAEETSGILDLGTLAFPAGKLAGGLSKLPGARFLATAPGKEGLRLVPKERLAVKAGRAAVSFGKFGLVFPEDEQASEIISRLQSGLESAGFGAVFPVVGKAISPFGKGIQSQVARLFNAIQGKLTRKTEENILKQSAKQLERAFFKSFLGRTAEQVVKEDLPKLKSLFQPLANSLRETLTEAGKIVEPNIEAIIEAGTIPKQAAIALGKLAKEKFPTTGHVFISENRDRALRVALVTVGGAMRGASKRLELAAVNKQIPTEIAESFAGFEQFFEKLALEFARSGRVAGRVLQSRQRGFNVDTMAVMAEYLEKIGLKIEGIPQQAQSITAFRQFLSEIKAVRPGDATSTFVRRIARPLLFPITSFVADTFTNLSRTLVSGQEAIIGDVFDFVSKGVKPIRTEALVRAIAHSSKTRAPSIMSPTAMSEQAGTVFGPKLDKLLVTGAVLKRFVDTQFGKIGFFSKLYEGALKEADKLGLKGIEKTSFIRRFVLEAPEKNAALISEARDIGNKLRFFGELTAAEEKIASNVAVQLLVTPFIRFPFQFIRFLAEFTPASPTFVKKLVSNKATSADFANYVVRNLEGVGSVYLVDQTLYDNIDWETFSYIDQNDKGETVRRSLSGWSPVPELIGIVALFRGEQSRALQAFSRGSVGFFGLQGILGRVFLTAEEMSRRGTKPDVESISILLEQFSDTLANIIPAKSVLAAIKGMLDPVSRDGFGRVIPGVGTPKVDALTGKPLEIKRTISIGVPFGSVSTSVPATPAFGSRLTEQALAPDEDFLRGIGIETRIRAPRIKVFAGTREVNKEAQLRFEQLRGTIIGATLPVLRLNLKSPKDMGIQERKAARDIVRRLLAESTRIAKAQMEAEGFRLSR